MAKTRIELTAAMSSPALASQGGDIAIDRSVDKGRAVLRQQNGQPAGEFANDALIEALRQKDALYRLTDRLHHAQSFDDIYDAALQAIVSGLMCDRASILLFDASGVMRFVASEGLSESYREALEGHSPWAPGETNPAPIALVDFMAAGIDPILKTTIAKEGIRAAAFVPLVADGSLIGKFMSYFDHPHVFSDNEIELSLTIARQLAFAIQRRRSYDMLRARERLFREMIDALPAAIYMTDAEGHVTHFNQAAVEFSGNVPELGSAKWCVTWKLYMPDGTPLPHSECPMAVALKEGRVIRGVEAIALRPDGSRRWFTPYPTPLFDEQGRITGGINMLLDITERKQAEEAIRQSEARYRSLLSILPAGIYICEAPTGVITFYNGRAAQLWGREPRLNDIEERFCGSFRLWLPDGTPLPHEQTPVVTAMTEGRSFRGEELIIERPDGSRVSALVNIDPLRDANGAINGVLTVFIDVTRLKDTENELRQKTRQLSAFLETAAIGLHRVGIDGTILWANEAELNMLGYLPEEYIGRQFAEFHADPDVAAHLLDCLKGGETVRDYKAPMKCKDGSIKTVLIDSSVLWEDGRFIHTQCFTRDITERERAEQLRETIEAERREADRRKDEFLAMLAHELRNPLAPIFNAVQLMRLDQNQSRMQMEARAVIERQTAQLARLVDDLLEVSRITTGRIQLRREWVAISGIVERAVETVRSVIGHYGHALVVSIPPEPIWLYADAARIEQVLVNLLNNAAKYTPAGGRIELGVERNDTNALISVRDTGIGIEPQLLPRVFELFTQAERSLDRAHGGLGVGLSVVKRLTEMHDGTVTVNSVLGTGSEFIVQLPAPLNHLIETAVREVDGAHFAGQAFRILVVDDNVDAAETVTMLLQSSGHDVRIVYDGVSALEAAGQYRPDVVMLDIGLPKLNGYEVARELRRDPNLKGITLIAMTGYGQTQDRELSQEAGFDAHLVKPVDYPSIERTFEELQAVRGSPFGSAPRQT